MREPRIIFWDLETLPIWREVLKVYPRMSDYPGRTLKAQITSIICFGYRVFGEGETKVINAWDFPERWEKDVSDDELVVAKAVEILSEADAIVTFNGKRFDEKVLSTRIMKHKMRGVDINLLPQKIPHIDLCQVVRSKLALFGNNLDNVSEFLTGERKLKHTGWEMWEKVWYRDRPSMDLMSSYCGVDVTILEADFKVLRPFISNIPNYNLESISKELICPNCSSTRIQKRGYYRTKVSTFHRYVCNDCNSWSRTDASDRNVRSL